MLLHAPFLIAMLVFIGIANPFHTTDPVSAKKTVITGTITDCTTGDAIPQVKVVLKDSAVGTMTDYFGRFTLQVNADSVLLSCSHEGYKLLEKQVDCSGKKVRFEQCLTAE